MQKLEIARTEIKNRIIDPNPPEKEVAISLYLYGITEQEFADMKNQLGLALPIPTFVKIQNHLRDEWRKDYNETI